MVREVIEIISSSQGLVCDATVGMGGHAQAILEAFPHRELLAMDRDGEALEQAKERLRGYGDRVTFLWGSYGDLYHYLKQKDLPCPGAVLLDLGASTPQLLDPARGFSLRHEGPLDMRMDRSRGPTALEMIMELQEADLADIIWRWGQEQGARRIARAIKSSLTQGRLKTTLDLAHVVESAVGSCPSRRIHKATKTFQALRIAVNGELDSLQAFLDRLPAPLSPNGRLVTIAFHSLEDRLIKERVRELEGRCTCPQGMPICACHARPLMRSIFKGALKPDPEEVRRNPRARSARLRAAMRVEEEA